MVPLTPTVLKTGDIVELPGIRFRFERGRASTPVKHFPLPEGPNLSTLMQGQTSVSVASEPAPKRLPKYNSREETPLAKLASASVQGPRDKDQSEPPRSVQPAVVVPASAKKASAAKRKGEEPKPALLPPASIIGPTKGRRSGSEAKSASLSEPPKAAPLGGREKKPLLPLRDKSPVRPHSKQALSKNSPKNGKESPTEAKPTPPPQQAKAKGRSGSKKSSHSAADPTACAPSLPPQYYLGFASHQHHFDLALASLQAWPQFARPKT